MMSREVSHINLSSILIFEIINLLLQNKIIQKFEVLRHMYIAVDRWMIQLLTFVLMDRSLQPIDRFCRLKIKLTLSIEIMNIDQLPINRS
jgi:hypothetical protein